MGSMRAIKKLKESMDWNENVLKLCEECGELTQAVVKDYLIRSPSTRQSVIEEMVDVWISMDVIRAGLEITDAELIDMRHHKMKRNLQRIGG